MVGRCQRLGWFLFGLMLFLSSTAAAITQPTTGVTIPIITPGGTTCSDKNVQICLDQAEGTPGAINALKDALVAPETFQPTCKLTFVPIVKGGSIFDAFGWYNVREDPLNPGQFIKPPVSQMYGMFSATGFQTGAMLAGQSFVLDLSVEKKAGRYLGGAIGFFLAGGAGVESIDPMTHKLLGPGGAAPTPQFMFFTQHALNSANAGAMPGSLYYNVLTWQSVKDATTFYFGWEDLPIWQGSDSDFDDFVFSVSGVQCGGGGEACDTGKLGPCMAGTLQCRKGVLTCVQTIMPAPETCNAVDDDCNGKVDDGMLCAADQVCDRGKCVSNCEGGEFPCPPDTGCTTSGVCVETACVDKVCPAGQVCKGGDCVEACTGVVCPYGLACRNGGCVDLCKGLQCDPGSTCVLGVCQSCACSECDTGKVCHQNLCIDTGCETQTCMAGSHCEAGQCKGNCDGAVCPRGQLCSNGDCVVDPTAAASGGSGGSGGGEVTLNFSGGTSVTYGGDGMVIVAGSTGTDNRHSSGPAAKQACGCKLPGQRTPGSGAAAALGLALFGLSRRRRPRSKQSS
jgi:hypothetical protein